MAVTRAELVDALSNPNVRSFLRVIRSGESSQDESAYRLMFGGEHYDGSLFAHPRIAKKSKWGWTSAFGAYQIMAKVDGKVKTDTYDWLARELGPSMEPPEQDIKAVRLLASKGAIDALKEGRFHEAVRRCSPVWASLPGNNYGQPQKAIERLLAVYQEYGGTLNEETPTQTQEVKPVAPIVIPLLEVIAGLIPNLGKLFGSGSDVANRNVAAATLAADAIVKVTNSVNLQDAVEKVQNDPDALNAAKEAVAQLIMEIGEAGGGGIDGARKAAAAFDGDWRKVLFSAPFMLAVAVLPLIYAVVLAALLKFDWLAEITSEVRTGVITSVTGLILGSLMGYFYGTSASSQRKDAALAAK